MFDFILLPFELSPGFLSLVQLVGGVIIHIYSRRIEDGVLDAFTHVFIILTAKVIA